MKNFKYHLPPFLENKCSQQVYQKWLRRKAANHVKRDRDRGNIKAKRAEYVDAIHRAVLESRGQDAYTGEPLDWALLSKYDNKAASKGGRNYKKKFAELPTVDHVGDGMGAPDFKISSWRVNDSKSDLTVREFLDLCRKVLNFHRA